MTENWITQLPARSADDIQAHVQELTPATHALVGMADLIAAVEKTRQDLIDGCPEVHLPAYDQAMKAWKQSQERGMK